MKSQFGWLLGTVSGVLIALVALPLMPLFWLVSKLND